MRGRFSRTMAFVPLLAGVFALPNSSPAQQGAFATTVQLPTFGVAVDADGLLRRQVFEDPTGTLMRQKAAAARAALPADLGQASPLRKVSLVQLERAIATRRQGQAPDDIMAHLAGLTRIQYVFVYPDRGDVVIAGPAEGWVTDLAGRVRGLESGLPILRLDDLAVALRAYPPGGRGNLFVGCTIDPTREGLKRLSELQSQVPRVIQQQQREAFAAQLGERLRESLGQAQIRVFGVPAESHFAQVLIEADYRMKLIGIGLEPTPVKMSSYLDLLTGASARHGTLERWWFTPNYECLRVTADRQGFEMLGQGVQLLTEQKRLAADGGLSDAPTANRASELFTQAFTSKYPEIAAASPVYAQLRGIIDLTIAAAVMQRQDYYSQANWPAEFLRDDAALAVAPLPTPKEVDCVINALWKGNRLLAPASGGVQIQAEQALNPKLWQADERDRVARLRADVKPPPADRWWWD